MSSLSLHRGDLLRHIGRHLGWPRDVSTWSSNQVTDGNDIIGRALRQLYQPPILPGETVAHTWACLKPLGRITLTSGVETYDLPDDFGGLVDDRITYRSDNAPECAIEITSEGRIRAMRQREATAITGYPHYGSILPTASDGDEPQRWNITLWPAPDAAYELTFRYHSDPYNLMESKPYPLGGLGMAEALLQSCIAAADAVLNDTPQGESYIIFIERLRAAIAHERKTLGPFVFGYNSDPSVHREEYWPSVTRVVYNGTEL